MRAYKFPCCLSFSSLFCQTRKRAALAADEHNVTRPKLCETTDCETTSMASVVASCDLAVCSKLSLDGDGRLVCDDSGEPCPVDDDEPSGAPDEWPGLRDSPDRVQGRAKGGAARTPHAQHQTSGGSAGTDRSGQSSARG